MQYRPPLSFPDDPKPSHNPDDPKPLARMTKSILRAHDAVDVSPKSETPLPLTLRGVVEGLTERGVKIAYSTLSELMSTGDIAEQLGRGGDAGRREFHPDTVDVLAGFLPAFRRAGGKTPQAPAMLRSFLKRETAELVPVAAAPGGVVPTSPTLTPDDYMAAAAVQGREAGLALSERVMAAREAAAFLGVSVGMLRANVPPFRRFGNSARGDRWLLSDLVKRG